MSETTLRGLLRWVEENKINIPSARRCAKIVDIGWIGYIKTSELEQKIQALINHWEKQSVYPDCKDNTWDCGYADGFNQAREEILGEEK